MSKSLELNVKINPLWTEYVSDILIKKIGCCGVVTDEKYYDDEVLIKESNGIVKGYLPVINDRPLNIENIQDILFQERKNLVLSGIQEENLGEWTLFSVEIPDEDWAHSWKQYWYPQKISEKVVICPSWEKYNISDDEIIINLDPGSAFGTGTHPTTRLCVQALEKVVPEYKNDVKIADIGTGSGILAVTGIKLGADFAVGIDNDASVISVAVENAEKNNAADKCRFYTGVASDVEGEYEIVVSNILAHILIEAMPDLVSLIKQDGKLILSGIIAAKSQDVQDSTIQNGLKIIEVLEEESWVAIIAEK